MIAFLPLLYNRRHFGVMTVFVAITHASYIVNWYFAFSSTNKYEALLFANTSYGQLSGFPFEVFGIFSLTCLMILAATSHDFWLKFLTPRLWKGIHYLIYAAYISVVTHFSLGVLQDQQNSIHTVFLIIVALIVGLLHLIAAFHQRKNDDPIAAQSEEAEDWVKVCDISEMREGYAKIAQLSGDERVAVYLQDGKLFCNFECLRPSEWPPW